MDNYYMIQVRKYRESVNGRLEMSDWTWEIHAYNDEARTVIENTVKGITNKLNLSKKIASFSLDGILHITPKDMISFAKEEKGKIVQVGVVSEDDLAEIICAYLFEKNHIEKESKDL